MRLLLFFLVTSITIFFSCNTTEPEMKVQYPPGYQHYQHDIPWPSLADSPWPAERGDAQGTGRSRSIGPKLGKVTVLFDSVEIYSGFAVGSDSTIYTSGIFRQKALSGIHLIAIGKDNKLKYAVKVTNPFKNFLTPICLSDGSVIFGDDNPFTGGAIVCCDKDGNIKWSYNFKETLQLIQPGIDRNGNIYIVTVKHKLYVIDKNGNLVWDLILETTKDLYCNGMVFSPDGCMLYITGSLSSVIAVDVINRKIKWKFGETYLLQTPVIDNDGSIYVCGKPLARDSLNSVTKLNDNGIVIWRYFTESVGEASPVIDRYGNIICSFGKKLMSINTSGKINWIKETINRIGYPLCCDYEGNIYVLFRSDENGYTSAGYSKEGKLIYQISDESWRNTISNPAVINGKLYFGTLSKIKIIE